MAVLLRLGRVTSGICVASERPTQGKHLESVVYGRRVRKTKAKHESMCAARIILYEPDRIVPATDEKIKTTQKKTKKQKQKITNQK